MIIRVAQGRVDLQDADEFKSFKIVAAPGVSPAGLRDALAGIATVEADGKTAWVTRAAVRRLRGPTPPAEWLAAFDRMIESVRRFGWVNDTDDTVRAHIETTAG